MGGHVSKLAAARQHLRRILSRHRTGQRVLTLADVLYEEGQQIHGDAWELKRGDGNQSPPLKDIYLELNNRKTAALCLSGGGIRSASFALGLLQCFASDQKGSAPEQKTPAKDRLLAQFHYLSTVSGGGYIGSWLSAWLTRAGEAGPTTRAIEDLGRLQADTEPPQITNLRSDSNYLTPKVGALSADLWADLAMIVRNLVLNWAIILPALCVVVLIAKGYAAFESALTQPAKDGSSPWLWVVLIAALLAFLISLSYQSANRPSQGRSNRTQGWFLLCDLAPALIAAALAALVIGSGDIGDSLVSFARLGTDDGWWPVDILLALIGAGLYLAGWLLARVFWHRRRNPARGIGEVTPIDWRVPGVRARELAELLWGILAGALFGLLVALGADLLAAYPKQHALLVLILGAPVILLAQLIAQIFFVGAISLRQPDDDDREWLARAGGWYAAAIVAWVALMVLVFLDALITDYLRQRLVVWLSSVGGISGAITLVLGKSSLTSPSPTHRKRDAKSVSVDTILAIATPIFAAALVIAASALLDKVMFGKPFTETALFGGTPVASSHWFDCPPVMLLVALIIAVAFTSFASCRINVNRFSLHALYRNRLIRAFLAASRVSPKGGEIDRPKRNLFTDVDPDDNLPMWKLWDRYSSHRGERWRPFHVINMALNIVSSKNLAWQERKAEPFTVSALHSGSGCRAFDGPGGPGAFQPTQYYGGKPGFGLSLGTAMAISGAAASPNMGYNSSPAVTFLMAMFNVRLGWWLPNPGKAGAGIHATDGPRWALGAFLAELFGLTQDDRRYVYLSDGGHFEDLGLYEMVRRRCRYIIVSDADCDPDFAFEDLGNAIRKIQIDLGIRIEMKGIEHLKKRRRKRQVPDDEQRYYATGVIHYREVDGDNTQDGHLLYIKPGLRWSESPDILSYALAHPEFPHETTLDQWFTESQFESYRHLGFTTGMAILKEAGAGAQPTWKEVFDGLPR
jgi:hypothetical protein